MRHFAAETRLPCAIKVNRRPELNDSQRLAQQLATIPEATPETYFPDAYKAAENPTWVARKLNIPYSAWKLMAVANLITGKHIYDAMNILADVDKYGGPVVKSVLEAARKNGENKGF